MPTRLPVRPPAPIPAPGLAGAWLAGLILLAAALGGPTHGACAGPALAPPAAAAAGPGEAELRDMLAHD